MPIRIEEFEDDDLESRSTAELVVEFLWRNRDKAFTRSEIATGIDRKPNTVGTNLSRLKDRGLVRHRGNYWAITDETDRLRDAFDLSRMARRLTDEDGGLVDEEEDAAAWAAAQSDEPHPGDADPSDPDGDG